ncbi:unnamed protein product [Cuscuta campestris]|uniref:C3H1-type domain-containing protein n=1 Tax=Cuscuta campestris TaxID=132261 RepID=A0A484KTQ5_9ASTE|nr:unnamed protein product [Cuscuta campestris]
MVRLFLSEDSPSQVGFIGQDHLQAKPSHASGITSDDNLPPGFEGAQASNLWRTKLFQIPVIKWEYPPRFKLEANWRVVSGEESQEREVQKQREMRVLEAIYPRPSAIPLNPSATAEHTVVHTDNQHTPLIPITSIEEDDAADTILLQHDAPAAVGPNPTNLTPPLMEGPEGATVPSHSTTTAGASSSSSSSGSSLEPDDSLTVALAALSSIMANDHGNLIDSELLVKILSDPQIIGQLVTHQGGGGGSNLPAMKSSNGPANVGPPGFSFSNPTTPLPVTSGPINLPPPPPPPRMVGPTPSAIQSTSSPSSSSKDMNYYKSLIQQHGGERQDTLPPPPPPPRPGRGNQHIDSSPVQEPPLPPPPQLYNTGWGSQHIDSSPVQEPPPPVVSSRSSRDPNKPKIMKPCMFFNSQRGCRHGVKCAFLHDSPAPPPPSQRRVSGFPDVQSTKRMKMDREITGT